MRWFRRLLGPLVAGFAVAAYAAAFRDYGIFDLADEGTLLAQAWRVASGQVPYVDFATGYGPLYFLVQGGLVAMGGLAAVRWALVATHGLAAALLFALARRVVGARLAVLAVLLHVAFFLPIAPAKGAPFNVPYPAWYAGIGGLALPLLLADPAQRAPHWDAFFAGMLAAVVFTVKLNSGAFLLAGGVAAIVLRGPVGRAGPIGRLALLVIALGSGVLLGPTGLGVEFWVLVPPLAAIAWLGGMRGAPDRESVPRLLVLVLGFVLVAGALFAAPYVVLGRERFTREVLLIGAGIGRIYARPFPWPAVVGAAFGFAGFLVSRRRLAPVLVLAGLGIAIPGFGGALGAEHPAAALRAGVEQATIVLVPLVIWGALAVLRRPGARSLVAPVAVAVTGTLQLYPRPDFLHLMPVAPLLLPLALRVGQEALALVPGRRALAQSVFVGGLGLLAVVRLAPTAAVLRDVAAGRTVAVEVGGERLRVEPVGADTLRALATVVDAVRRATSPDDQVITFPACAIVTFFARRVPAGPHDYFFPGRPDRGQAAVLALQLGAERPPVAVTCNAAGTDLENAFEYYPELVGLLAARYRVRLERPPFTVYEALGRSALATYVR